jgi:hypothetical protein
VAVWIPDLFCNSSLEALRAGGVELTFYPVTEQLAPDMAVCRAMQRRQSPDIFLLVHYFGRPTATGAAAEFCARAGAWLVEDAAHVLRPVHSVGTAGDFVLYSPHKHLPIPEGAVLVVRPDGPAHLGPDRIASFGAPSAWVGQLGDLRQKLRCFTSRSRARTLLWLGKRVAQKLGLRSWNPTRIPYSEQARPGSANAVLLASPDHGCLARRLLTGLIADLPAIARWRERHQLLWDELLLSGSGPKPVAATERPSRREWTPYLAGYRMDAVSSEATYAEWQRDGLPVTTWPDLPPEVVASPNEHPIAWGIRHNRMYLPVHQSLSMVELIQRSTSATQTHPPTRRLELWWDNATRDQWGNLLAKVDRSNLLQSWDYGVAKESTSAWRVRRCIVYSSGEPIALVQVLQRRFAGILQVLRINRGPIFLTTPGASPQSDVWNELARLGSLRHGRVLTAAPELELAGSALRFLAQYGLKQLTPIAWESAWIDLRLDLVTLRKRLDGKWRNMLASAEKAGLELEICTDDRSFEWMLARYRENMQQKKFYGPEIALLRGLRENCESPPIILRALMSDEAVAGICIIRHGLAATYLLGWSGNDGRNMKANQFLLWEGVGYLKQNGLRWLDLGGFSEEQTPGIAAFKLGMNGERFESVGEFWKW